MYAPHASEARHRGHAYARMVALALPVLVGTGGTVWLTLALADGNTRFIGDAPVAGAAVAMVVGFAAYHMVRIAWQRHAAADGTPCRSGGWLGVGAATIALTGVAIPVAWLLKTPACDVGDVVAVGLTLSSAAFLPGLLLMPGAATSVVTRVRRALDGASVGMSVMFTCWVLLIAPKGRVDSTAFWAAIVTCCMLAIAVIVGLRPAADRRAASLCAGGVCGAVLGLSGLGFSIQSHLLVGFPSAFGALLIGSTALMWSGAKRTPVVEETQSPDASMLAIHPVLNAPAAIAVVVALHRLLTGGEFDRASIVLGVLTGAVVALRETLAARDVAHSARHVAEREAQYRTLIAGSADVIMVLGSDLTVRWQSAAAARQFGLSDQEVVGRHFQSMVHPEDAVFVAERLADVRVGYGGATGDAPVLVEARLRDGFGRWRETETAITDQRAAPEVSGLVVHIRDIGERKEMERTLHRMAYADALTGLANRRQMLTSIVAKRCAPRVSGSLLLVELDGFNAVNDVRGYDIGDAVLIEVARRLRAGAAPGDLPARLSGDEFAVVTESAAVQAYALATRLLTMLAEPIQLPGVTVHLSASIGMTDIAGAVNGDDVLRRADLALRRAKLMGRGRVEWYDAAVEEAIARRMNLEQDLPEALSRGEFDLIYQPILDLVHGRPFAVEALLRWRHPVLGTLLPADVIPVAEDLGLISDIGQWVLRQASRQLATWLREGRDLSMAVNVSPHQLAGTELAAEVGSVIGLHELPAERLVLELAEAGLHGAELDGGTELEDRVGELRALGVRTALDEFGSGADSLTHLRNLPIDIVKIGRSYFEEAQPGRSSVGRSVPLIDVMVGLGRRLGIDVVAQGLEAPADLDIVRAAGCRMGQGHLFARPQPAERTEAYLDAFPVRR